MHDGAEGFGSEGEALRRVAELAEEQHLAEVAVSEMLALVRALVIQSLTGRQSPTDDF